jgi:hypothetical protein
LPFVFRGVSAHSQLTSGRAQKSPRRVPHPAFLSRVGGFVEARPSNPHSGEPRENTPTFPRNHHQKHQGGCPILRSSAGWEVLWKLDHQTPTAANHEKIRPHFPAATTKNTKVGAPSCVAQQGGRFCSSSTIKSAQRRTMRKYAHISPQSPPKTPRWVPHPAFLSRVGGFVAALNSQN